MKPAKKFVLGAVYAFDYTGKNVWEPCVCTSVFAGRTEATLAILNSREDIAFSTHGGNYWPSYRIRARDWDKFEPEQSNVLGEYTNAQQQDYERSEQEYNAYVALMSTTINKLYSDGNKCTCGMGNTIEARQHYDSCELKKGK